MLRSSLPLAFAWLLVLAGCGLNELREQEKRLRPLVVQKASKKEVIALLGSGFVDPRFHSGRTTANVLMPLDYQYLVAPKLAMDRFWTSKTGPSVSRNIQVPGSATTFRSLAISQACFQLLHKTLTADGQASVHFAGCDGVGAARRPYLTDQFWDSLSCDLRAAGRFRPAGPDRS